LYDQSLNVKLKHFDKRFSYEDHEAHWFMVLRTVTSGIVKLRESQMLMGFIGI